MRYLIDIKRHLVDPIIFRNFYRSAADNINVSALILTWGFLPVVLGFGFIFRPRLMAKLQRAYAKKAQKIQKKFLKAHRATGLFFINVGVLILLTAFYPVWIFNGFLLARIVVGFLFPSLFQATQTVAIVPTVWI